jgi:hypothetical protein
MCEHLCWTTMTARQKNRLIALISNPPPGSKLAAAKEYGLDLTLLVGSLEWTPTKRLRNAQSAARFMEQLRLAGEKSRAR